MCYSSNNFVVHVCYQRKDKHINIFFCMLHHEDSPEKPQHNMTTSLFLDKLPIMPYTLSFLGKIFRPPPPTPLHPHFHKFWKSRPHNGGTGNLKIFIVYWFTMH